VYGKGVDVYQRTKVVTADPKRLVIMCYEEAIKNLKTARAKYLGGEYEAKGRAIQKAQDIISELKGALDFEKGGEIAKNLEALYNYMLRRTLEGDVKGDMNAIEEIEGILEELKGAWETIFYGNKKRAGVAPYFTDRPNKQVASMI